MALIESLEGDDWETNLRGFFDYALDLLAHDRHRPAGSAVDDLRAWLARGGVSLVKHRLDSQMENRRFTAERIAGIRGLIDRLAHEHRARLFHLASRRIIAMDPVPGEIAGIDLEQLLDRILAGERPFEEWMYSHGHSRAEVEEIYGVIDQWLVRHGIIPPPVVH